MDRMDPRIVPAADRMIRDVVAWAVAKNRKRKSGQALLALFGRVAGSWSSVCALVETSSSQELLDARSNDCAMILRAMYDAYIQAAYIACATKPNELGRLYLDYEHVERYKAASTVVKQSNKVARKVASSPLRAKGEKRIERLYKNVVSAYLMKDRKRVRMHWYDQPNLGVLAEKTGMGDEYGLFVKRFNSSVHSGPFAVMHGPVTRTARALEVVALRLVGKSAKLVVDNLHLSVEPESAEIIKATDVSILDALE